MGHRNPSGMWDFYILHLPWPHPGKARLVFDVIINNSINYIGTGMISRIKGILISILTVYQPNNIRLNQV